MNIDLRKQDRAFTVVLKYARPIASFILLTAFLSVSVLPLLSGRKEKAAHEELDVAKNFIESEIKRQVKANSDLIPSAPYTIVLGEGKQEAIIRFPGQGSELHLKNLSEPEYNCLVHGGGVNCVLSQAFRPKIKSREEAIASQKNHPSDESLQKKNGLTRQMPGEKSMIFLDKIKITGNFADDLIVICGVILGIMLVSIWSSSMKKQ